MSPLPSPLAVNLVLGLPGSGKSTFLSQQSGLLFDDPPEFPALPSSLLALRPPWPCAVWLAHPMLCLASYQDTLRTALEHHFPTCQISWWAFTNDPVRCRHNLLHRSPSFHPATRPPLATVSLCSHLYHLPPGAHVLPVWHSVAD